MTGKYGVRYGATLRKSIKKMEITQHATYTCTFCGKDSVKRTAVGIWHCKACKKTTAGGAWTVSTTAAATVRRLVALRLVATVAWSTQLTLSLLPLPAPSVACVSSPRSKCPLKDLVLCL